MTKSVSSPYQKRKSTYFILYCKTDCELLSFHNLLL